MAPDVFAFLRERDGFTREMLRESLDPIVNRDMVFKAGEGQGKSGSFFFFSKDQNFIIKTMTDEDFDAFVRIQKPYFDRICSDKESLLARIYGIYSIQMEDQAPVKLVVMGNTMKTKLPGIQTKPEIIAVYDLKGSTVSRIVKGNNHPPTKTLKDENL